MKNIVLFCWIALLACTVQAQQQISVRKVEKLPEGAVDLLTSDAELRGKVVETERAIDLVKAVMVDSLLEKKRQRLAGPGGWMAQRLGSRYWEYLDTTKRKYVGTMSRDFKIYDGMGDEYDINIFLMPHLPAYIDMAWEGFQVALRRPRNQNHFRFDEPEDYPCPEQLRFEDKGYLTIECEVSPDHTMHSRLTEVFLPMGKGHHELETWPQTGTRFPSFGMYGAWCMDCNHNCRPEIHPFEWLWWLDLSEDRPGGPHAKSWMFAAFRDDSRRFNDWSPGPLDGLISFPVAIPAKAKSGTVILENLLYDALLPQHLWEKGSAWHVGDSISFSLPNAATGRPVEIAYRQEGIRSDEGILLWWSDFEEESESEVKMGYLNIRLSVETIYAGRLTVDWE